MLAYWPSTEAEAAGLRKRPLTKTDRWAKTQHIRSSSRKVYGEKHSVIKMLFLLNADLGKWREVKGESTGTCEQYCGEKRKPGSQKARVVSNKLCSLACWGRSSHWQRVMENEAPLVSPGESGKLGTRGLGMRDSGQIHEAKESTKRVLNFGLEGFFGEEYW